MNAHELSETRALCLASLALGSILLGYRGRDLFIGFGTSFWSGSIFNAPFRVGAQLAGEFLASFVKRFPLFGSRVAVGLVFIVAETLNYNLSFIYFNPGLHSLNTFVVRK